MSEPLCPICKGTGVNPQGLYGFHFPKPLLFEDGSEDPEIWENYVTEECPGCQHEDFKYALDQNHIAWEVKNLFEDLLD